MAQDSERPRRRRTTPVDPRLSPEALRRIAAGGAADEPEERRPEADAPGDQR